MICGETAAADLGEETGLELRVCAAHVMPVYRLQLYIAMRELSEAVYEELLFRPSEAAMTLLKRMLPRLG